MEVYKNLTIGNFGTLSWILGMKFGLSSTNPYNKYCPTVQTKLESRRAEFANIIFGQKGENKTRKDQGVYTKYLFWFRRNIRRRRDDRIVSSIDDADEYIALFHQVERGLTCLMKTLRNAATIFSYIMIQFVFVFTYIFSDKRQTNSFHEHPVEPSFWWSNVTIFIMFETNRANL